MALLDRFRRQVKQFTGKRLHFLPSFWFSPPERNERGFLSAYGEIYSLFGITLRIATGVGEVKWRLYKGSERSERSQIADHPILKLLDYANEFQTGQEITELMQLHLDLVGKAYWYLPRNNLGVPGEIWIISPHMIRIVPSAKEFIAGYIFTGTNERIPLGKDEIIRFSMPDPLNPYGGVGHAQAAAVELDAEDSAGKWNRNFFYNSARPDAALEYEGTLSDEEFEKLREQWQARHGGLGRAHKTAILEGGVKYKQIQISQKDMDFAQLRKMTRENLLFTFGMPLSVMGISENVNRANAEAGDYTFARWLVKPRLTRIKNKLNEQLVPMFPLAKGVELDFDEVVPETVDQKKGLAESGVKAGWMTINEARKLNSLDPVPKGDVFLIPFNMMPTPADKPIKPPPSAQPSAPKAKLTPSEWEDEWEGELPHWATDLTPSLFAQEFTEEMRKYKVKSVLEVGCGNGRDSIFFARAGFDVTAIDVVPRAIEIARENAEEAEVNIEFQVANAERLPFPDSNFGAIFSLSVLHSTNLKLSLPQISRVLRNKGIAFIYLYADTQFASGAKEEYTTVDEFMELVKSLDFGILDFYSEQEDEFDEFGEKHKLLVSLLQKGG